MTGLAKNVWVSPDLPGFDAILDSLPDPVLLLEAQGAILWCNTAANRAFEQVDPSLPVSAIFPRLTQSLPAVTAPVHLQLESGHQKFEATLTRLDANFIILTARAPQSTSLTRDDVDELTGAAKRNALMRAIDGELAGARQFAVHCIDLDRFKVINDTLGHGVGDLLLQKVADRLKSACRAGDMVARLGGDEFVILQRDVPSSEEAERLSARIVDLVGRTYVLSGHTINIGASVGVALREERQQARDLLRDADLALYEAKRAGKGRFRVFEPDMQVSLRERRELEIDLRRALALRQFRLNYQPFVELEGNNIRGFEALLRWQHPVRGNVPPLDFIPMAEETGLIVKIGEWVLRTACEAAVSWPENLTIAVNVSPLQFKSDNLLDTVEATLKETGLAANRLELEITESALLDDTENVLATLHALRGLGVKISMDDFGTGYSSLSYLQKFPFDKIKIDRSFVVGESSDSQAILKAVAGLGSSLGIAITAEGVETSDQLEHIRSQNCTHVQGYFTGRPMNDAAVADLLQSQMRKNTNA